MDEVLDFCVRVLGSGRAAEQAASEARSGEATGRAQQLAVATRACRAQADSGDPDPEPVVADLAGAVAIEMARATASLPERHREALALRDSLRLSHADIAGVMGIEPVAVAPLLARARLQLRAVRRGSAIDAGGPRCEARDRAWRLLALRMDSEPFSPEDDAWLHAHLDDCAACRRDHAAMLEASACYRAWRLTASSANAAATPNAS